MARIVSVTAAFTISLSLFALACANAGGDAPEVAENTRTESSTIPGRVTVLSFQGDLRLRYQWEGGEREVERHSGKYRFRLGGAAPVATAVTARFGLVTGGTNPRSTNQTLRNTFETPDIRLDYAFMEYAPSSWVTLYGGKFKRGPVLWQPSDLMWDSDINPEGVSACFSTELNSRAGLFTNIGMWVLDELEEESDPTLYVIQPGIFWELTGTTAVKGAVIYYVSHDVQHASLDHSAGTNTIDESQNLAYKYDVLSPSMEIVVTSLGGGPVSCFAVSADYVHNPDPDEKRSGYLIKTTLGTRNVAGAGQWQFTYSFRRLERDAWLDTFPDSNFHGGETDAEGHEAIFKIGVARNLVLGLDYYSTGRTGGDRESEKSLQVDLQATF